MIALETTLSIQAPPGRVWEVLADFAAYPRWNPLLPRARGVARPGARVAFAARLRAGLPAVPFSATIRTCDGTTLEWTGGLPGLLTGRHSLALQGDPAGTRVVHREEFAGLLAWALGRRLVAWLRPAYEAMDQALARRLADPG